MVLIFWWIFIVWFVALLLYVVYKIWLSARHVKKHDHEAVPIAHSDRLTALPEYVMAVKKYQRILCILAGLVTLALALSVIATARPAQLTTLKTVQRNKDIMLCLDVSGSVLNQDAYLLNNFSNLAKGFNGERLGLSIFNSSGVNVLPLSSNYKLIQDELKRDAKAFQTQTGPLFDALTSSTLVGYEQGTSILSDGVNLCLDQLDGNSARSKSIVLATDGEQNGKAIVDMNQVIQKARNNKVRIYVFDPGVSDQKLADSHKQLSELATSTEGMYTKAEDKQALSKIYRAINQQATSNFTGTNQVAQKDNPLPVILVIYVCVIGWFIYVWRFKV